MSPQERKRRVRRIVLVAGLAVLVIVGAAAAYVLVNQPKDVSNPDVEFRAEPSATPTPEEQEPETQNGRKVDPVDRFVWAQYGYTRDRRRYLPLKKSLEPPYKELWQYNGSVLLEFPPVIGGKFLYLLDDAGRLMSFDKHTGHRRWRKKLGALAAASPAYAGGTVYAVLLARAKSGGGARAGRVVALDGKSGKVKWSQQLSSRSESSPLVADGTLYFGSESGRVYALNAATGKVRWVFQAGGAVKGAVALADGRLYFGDYGGRAYAISAATGRQIWRSGTSGTRLGLGSGNFYSSPAVAYGRVYMGNTDGRMYSFSARTGQLAWSKSLGGYVYSSPAVAQVPGYAPTVYVGSYSGRFYALDARSGAVRWVRGGFGRISGGASVIGDVVWFADLGHRKSIALGARTGRTIYVHERGSYNPTVSDGEAIFIAGYHALYALEPLSAAAKRERAKAAKARAVRLRKERGDCRARAKQAHRGHPGAVERSIERCVKRRDNRRRAERRAECAKAAHKAHKGESRRVRGMRQRSYQRCVDRRHAHKR
jgi:outer membrane protein assembly factor BamB